jgi:hypothetical protein
MWTAAVPLCRRSTDRIAVIAAMVMVAIVCRSDLMSSVVGPLIVSLASLSWWSLCANLIPIVVGIAHHFEKGKLNYFFTY